MTAQLTNSPDPADVDALQKQLVEYNKESTGYRDGVGFGAFIRDEDGELVAGIHGFTWGGVCEVELLWVDESRRGQGLGAELLDLAEREARERGCDHIALTTYDFQAPGFYLKQGFEIVGENQGHPRGHTHFMLRKPL